MRRGPSRSIYSFLLLILLSSPVLAQDMAQNLTWETAIQDAKGQTVDWYMWGGSPTVNTYVNDYLAKQLKDKYQITLRQVPVKDIAEVVSKLVVEKQAGKNSGGSVDLMWINGENFRTCKAQELLYGPFAETLPNSELIDWSNPTVGTDFGTPVEYMESPWGSAQLVMIYDEKRTPSPPKTVPDLIQWIKDHPGRFAYPAPPDFTGSAFLRHLFYENSSSVSIWQENYTAKDLKESAEATYQQLKELKPYLWRAGSTYPESPVKMNTLFADNEIDFSFSYNQGEASRNILDGIFPESVRTYVFDTGTIANTHFVAIPYNAQDKAAAMVVANFLLSPEAQLKKSAPEVWGDFPVIDPNRLDVGWKNQFKNRPQGLATLDDTTLQSHQLPEPPSKILTYLEKGWVKSVLKNR